ncbi:MAG TPA: hypothetical protein VKU36_03325 [Candidatus Babeliales bacterium]|jgi:hypothetical protein|nr:hypothetical protein [Candidatus Babeliales bacterium]
MMKKTLLSLLLTASTLATAHINLNVNMTVMNDGTERQTTHNILVEENVHTPIMFESEEPVIIDFLAETDGSNVDITVQFFQQTKDGEMITATEPLNTQTPFNQPTTVTVHEPDSEENGVVLVITPTVL